MLDKMEVYYFSPTGGTKKVSSIFADAMEKEVIWHDLGSKEGSNDSGLWKSGI